MSLLQSAIGLLVSLAISIGCTIIDKKNKQDKYRLLICIAGIMALMCLFFLLINLLVAFGFIGK